MEETDEKLKELTMKDIQKIKDSREMGRTYMWLEEMMEDEKDLKVLDQLFETALSAQEIGDFLQEMRKLCS